MKRLTVLFVVCFIISFYLIITPTLFAGTDSAESVKNSCSLFAQIGLNRYTATEDPFDRFPNSGLGVEFGLGNHFALGSSVFYSKWSDYLGRYGGKYSFQVVKPALDLIYHFTSLNKSEKKVDFFSGASLAYNFIRIENVLNNEYDGDLSSHLGISPFIGSHFYLFGKAPGVFKKIAIFMKLYWTLNGDFSGLYGMAGISLKIN